MSEFFAMGGYGLYVWSAYAVTAVVLIGNVIAAVGLHRQMRRAAGEEEA